jgi:hypothetical protein
MTLTPSPPPTKTIYLGRFISAPHPGPNSVLQIKEGAVLVTTTTPNTPSDSTDPDGRGQSKEQSLPEGRIEKVDWDVSILKREKEEVRQRFGFGGEEEVEVVRCGKGGFFFPGFVGECFLFFLCSFFTLPGVKFLGGEGMG